MVTGDNILTAKHIATECGILTKDGMALEGPAFRKMSLDQLDKVIPNLQVLARCSPEDKFRLVSRLRELGEVVAVTGDGTNDAPALKKADVGFSMGIAGTEVAKDASDIVLLDDNFKSIVNAVKWGRNVYDSIRKFLQFQLTVNIAACFIVFIGAVSQGESPLSPIQMLWVNLIMDTLGALALATEAPTDELLLRRPYGRDDSIVTRKMWRFIFGSSIYQLSVLMLLLYAVQHFPFFSLKDRLASSGGLWSETDKRIRQTIVFNSFVFCQIFNEYNARKLHDEWNVFSGMFTNFIFHGVILFSVIMQVLFVEAFGSFAQTHPLVWKDWISCLVVGAISLPWCFLLKLIPIHNVEPSPEELRKMASERVKRLSHRDVAMEEQSLVDNAAPTGGQQVKVTKERVEQLWGQARLVKTQIGVINQWRRVSHNPYLPKTDKS